MIYFVSDVHLGLFDREIDKIKEEKFILWLKAIKQDCHTLVLLGDIFDYWFEYKTVIPAVYYRTLTIFKELLDCGIKIEYVMGNHDFGHNLFFKNELNIDIIKDDVERYYLGKKFYLSHGDGKAYNDHLYLILKKILRNRCCQKLFSLIHPDIGISLAIKSSRRSRKSTKKKDYNNGMKDGMLDFAKSKINEGYDFVVMGHRHLAEKTFYQLENHQGTYVNLGEWIENPHYGKFDGKQFELIKL